MSNMTLRIAAAEENSRIQVTYAQWGYRGGVSPTDIVYVAESGGELMGIVRRTCEHGVVMLRGMYVSPQQRRQGIGSQLLRKFAADLEDVTCYCVPFARLQEFYSQVGFEVVDDEAAPEFLRDRLALYRADGLDVLAMRRAVTPRNA